MTPFSPAWLAVYQQRINADPEMNAIGNWFTVSLSITSGDRRVVLRFDRGKLEGFVESPRIDVRALFGFRAHPEIWDKFLAPRPEPLYHDIFAMLMRVPGFVLEGDTLVAMQHARALHRAMNLMRDSNDAAMAPSAADVSSRGRSIEPIVGRYLNVDDRRSALPRLLRRGRQRASRCSVSTRLAPTAGSIATCSTTAPSRIAFASIAFDLPYHGRSNPPDGWWRSRHLPDDGHYLAIIRAVWNALRSRARPSSSAVRWAARSC